MQQALVYADLGPLSKQWPHVIESTIDDCCVEYVQIANQTSTSKLEAPAIAMDQYCAGKH